MNQPKNLRQSEDFEEKNFLKYAFELEKAWRKSLLSYGDKELFQIFPEAKEFIPEKILDWQEKYEKLAKEIKSVLGKVPKTETWFYDILAEALMIPELLKIESHIYRLKRQFSIISGSASDSSHWTNLPISSREPVSLMFKEMT